MKRKAARQSFRGLEPPRGFQSDGCTCAPDFWHGVDLRRACLWHDFAYTIGTDEGGRLIADQNFHHNLRASGCPDYMATFYYRRVRLWGARFYDYAPGHQPPWWHWFVRFVTRYRCPPE